jgi:predicted PurR-regulated permease PerM
MTAAVDRGALVFWVGLLAFFALCLYLLSPILLPFIAGMAIAYFLNPAVDHLERWLKRSQATIVVLLVFVVVLVIIGMLFLPLLQLQAAELVNRLPGLLQQGREQIQKLEQIAQARLTPDDVARLRDVAGTSAASALAWAGGMVEGLLTSGLALANLLSLVFITPIVAFFLLRDWEEMVATIDRWLPRRYAPTIREQAQLMDATLAGFIHGQLLVSLSLAVYYGIALTIVGLDFGVVIAVLIGILSFIPFVGVAICFVVTMGLTLLQFSDRPGHLLAVVLIFAVGQTVESNLLSPKLVGKRINLHPVWVIFALLAFGSLFGLPGVLIALPAAAAIGVLVRFGLRRYLESRLYDPHNRTG